MTTTESKNAQGRNKLIAPHPNITDEVERERIKVFLGSVLFFGVFAVVMLLVSILLGNTEPAIIGAGASGIVLAVASYVLGRSQRYQAAIWLFVLGLLAATTASAYVFSFPLSLGFNLLPIFFAAVVLPPRQTIPVAALGVVATAALTLIVPEYQGPITLTTANGIVVVGAVLAVRLAVLRQQDVQRLEARSMQVQELNRDLENRVEARTRDLELASEVSQQVSTNLDLDELLPQLVELTKERFDLYHAHVYLLNEEENRLDLAAGAGDAGRQMVAAKHAIPYDAERSIVARAARSGEPTLINDTKKEPDFLPNPLLPRTRSELAVPLKLGDEVLGVLDVQDDERDSFGPDIVRVLNSLASQVAVAVQNALSFSQVQAAQAETAEALDELASRSRVSAGVAQFATELLGTGLDGLDESLGLLGGTTDVSRAYILQAEGGTLTTFHEWTAQGIDPLSLDQQNWAHHAPNWLEVLRERNTLIVNDDEVEGSEEALLANSNTNSRLMLPIHVEDEFFGVMGFDDTAQKHEWDQDDINLLGAAAISVAYSIRSARLLTRTENALERVQSLYELSRKLTTADTSEDLLRTFTRPADTGDGLFSALVLHNAEGGYVEVTASHSTLMNGRIIPEDTAYPLEDFPFTAEIENNPTRLYHTVGLAAMPEGSALRAEMNAIGVQNMTVVPLVPSGGGLWLGVVLIGWAQDIALDEETSELYTLLAPQLATIIENRLLLEQTQATLSELDRIYSLPTELMGSASIDGHFQSLNPAWQATLGYERSDLLYTRLDTYIHPDDSDRTLNALRRLASGQRDSARFENRYRDADGEYHWLRWNATLDEERRLIYFSARDITDERRSQERQALAYSLGEQLATMLDPDSLLESTVQTLADTFDYYHVHIYAYNEQKETLVVRAGLGDAGQELVGRQHTIPLNAKRSFVAQSARELEPTIVDDVTEDPTHLPNPLLPKTRAEAAIPIASGSRLLGVLDIQQDRTGAFDMDEIRTLQIVANQLAISLSNATLFEQTETALAQTEMLYAGSEQIIKAQEPDQILEGVAFSTFLGQYMNQVMMVNFETPWKAGNGSAPPRANVAAVWGSGGNGHQQGDSFMLADTVYAPLVKQAEDVLVTDAVTDESLEQETRAALDEASIRAFTSLPITAAGDTLGLLIAYSDQVVEVNEEQMRQATNLVDQAAAVLQNLRLLEQTQEALNELSANEQQLQLFVENTPASVAMFDTNMEYLVVSRRWYEDFRLDESRSIVGSTHYEVFPEQDDRWKDIHQDALDGIAQSSPSDPYTHPDGTEDVLRWQIYPWYDAEGEIGGVVWFVDIITDEVRARRRQQTAYQVARQLTTSLDVDTLLSETVNRLADAFDYYYAQVYFIEAEAEQPATEEEMMGPRTEEESREILVVREGLGDAGNHLKMLGHSLPMYAGRSLVARAARSGEPVVVNNTREDPNHLPNPLLPDTASEVAIPLIAGDRTIGVLDIQQNTAYHFDEEEIQTLQIVANQLAVAIANAEFFQAVEEARSSYALLAENATDVISRHELHGQFTYVSPAASNLLGYTSAELLEMSIFDMMHHDDLARFGFEERSLFEERDVVNIEYRIQRKDEEYIWFETTARAVRDSKGEVVDMVAVSRDVTDRVIARQRQETAYELAQELSTSLDIDMLLERTVNQLADAFGLYHAHVYLLEDDALVVREGLGMAGQQLKQLGHSIPVDAARSVVARSARSRDPVVIDDVMADPTHLPNPLLPRTRSELALPLNVGDDLLGVLDVQHDVEGYFTQDVIQTLAIVSNQLSVALSNANLYQQQIETAERLREVDQLKSEFLATMSHELRTPLNSIIGYSELLIDELTEDLDEMSMEDLQAIHSSGHHLLAIINDILDIAKIESGRMEINRTELDVADFVQQVADMTRVQLRDRASVEMLIEMPDDLPPILADSVRMRQMMLNLTGNAAKFTEEGHIMIRVEMDDTWMYLKVVDTGTGIPEDAQDKVFDRFSQADSSATRKAGGTGLGLTVSRQLAQLHGGDLYLEESTPGEGSTFTLKMPLDAPAETQRADRANLATEEISAD